MAEQDTFYFRNSLRSKIAHISFGLSVKSIKVVQYDRTYH